ncbi:MAG: epoxyqueuosine reductase [candidate division Zixibacteria bacterium]|nr:epoxyqueuosine reductase [Candidatus Tariuqbacter arcticus]
MIFSSEPAANALELKEHHLKIGWCRVDELKRLSYLHRDLNKGMIWAVSIAFPLSAAVMDSLDKFPNLVYQNHYRVVNNRLETEALELSRNIAAAGFNTLPVPVTVSVDSYHGHLSHRMAAMLSGQGWIGKSALLVTTEYAARVRLVTILTNLPLPEQLKPIQFGCGDCRICIDVCPVNAIQDDPRDFKREICYKYLNSLITKGVVEELICGLCIKACDGGGSNDIA